MSAPLFYRKGSPEWRAAGLPCVTKAYELQKVGKLHLVRDAAGRVGVTAVEAARYFAEEVRPWTPDDKKDVSKAVAGRQAKRRAA